MEKRTRRQRSKTYCTPPQLVVAWAKRRINDDDPSIHNLNRGREGWLKVRAKREQGPKLHRGRAVSPLFAWATNETQNIGHHGGKALSTPAFEDL